MTKCRRKRRGYGQKKLMTDFAIINSAIIRTTTVMLCNDLDKIDPSEIDSEEYKKIIDLKEAVVKFIGQ